MKHSVLVLVLALCACALLRAGCGLMSGLCPVASKSAALGDEDLVFEPWLQGTWILWVDPMEEDTSYMAIRETLVGYVVDRWSILEEGTQRSFARLGALGEHRVLEFEEEGPLAHWLWLVEGGGDEFTVRWLDAHEVRQALEEGRYETPWDDQVGPVLLTAPAEEVRAQLARMLSDPRLLAPELLWYRAAGG
jgi:hypothetical protein